jgi:hypothetical protein
MRKGIDYPFQMTGFFAFGLILAVVVIVMFFIPNMLYEAYGKCWGDAYTSLQDAESAASYLTADQSKAVRITMGDCVGGVIFFKRDYFDSSTSDFGKTISQMEDEYCTTTYKGYKSFILMLPWKTVKEEATKTSSGIFDKIKKTWSEYWGYAKQLWDSKGRAALIKPACFGVEGVFTDKGGDTAIFLPSDLAAGPQNLNEKELSFCYEFTKIPSTDGVSYYRMEPAADSKCPDKK